MSEQWGIENDTGAELTVRAPNGFAVELDANSADPRERFAYFAIRQQARDIDQLRADLAAAVAERDEYWGALHSTKDDLFECRANQRTLESELRITRDQRDTLRDRLAAIDSAPTVAYVNSLSQTAPNYLIAELLPPQDRPAIGTELIARPAKD